eukprot:NODE_3740_length_924_cov_43.716571_g3439_i0.p1 GENE.NODE_3740_length_924_cov_43.716571_g3439_i0~~NODE_3740_length_924_cov_43.716571_g3439_i0.p1  ORF type:complete len:239 (-),score=41.01 NODE_3740_length_924_cov_43.716571_g3439_i0:206-853(-)
MSTDRVNGPVQQAMDDVKKGAFVRQASQFRNWITADGSSGFPAEANRYHLYVSLACPWAHRTMILRKLKGLEEVIGLTSVHHHMDTKGWRFAGPGDEAPPATPDPLYGFSRVKELYWKAQADYAGRFTVPVLWDKKQETIVSNESSEIIQMLNSELLGTNSRWLTCGCSPRSFDERHCGDGGPRAHQVALLWKSQDDQPYEHRAPWTAARFYGTA